MAESPDKAEQTAARASTTATPRIVPPKAGALVAEAAPVAPEPAAKTDAAGVPARRKIAEPVSKKPVAKVSRKIAPVKRVPARSANAAAAPASAPTITELKEQIMATAETTTTTDYSKPFTDAVSEFQSKAKAAYDKTTVLAAEATEFAKGNVEAAVESGKVYAAGVQELSKGFVEEAKSAYETFTADLKEFAAIKSPAELFQLQARLARRNFDAVIAYGSKNTDAVTKLASEAFAPISGRISLAAEKFSKAA